MAEGGDRGSDSTVTVSAAGDSVHDAGPGYGLTVGDRVGGRYRILRFLARGAMGEVYAAHDEELGATVALKTLRSQRADSGTALARFRREVLLTREWPRWSRSR